MGSGALRGIGQIANLRCFANFHPMLQTFAVAFAKARFEVSSLTENTSEYTGWGLGNLTGQTKQTPVY